MARTTSPRFQISYVNTATRDEPADVPADIKLLVDAFENSTPMWAAGTLAARPAAGKTGRFYWATDQAFISYDNGSQWTTVGPQPTLLVPTGAILPFGGSAAPAGYLLTDGASYLVADYTALHGVIGYAHGGSGANFNVPNMKGKVAVGRDAAQTEFDTLAESGGAKTHTLTTAQMAAHSHVVNSHNHGGGNHAHGGGTGGEGAHQHYGLSVVSSFGINDGSSYVGNVLIQYDSVGDLKTGTGPVITGGGSHAHGIAAEANIGAESPGTNNAGSDQAHNNLQPYLVVNHIIKT